MKNTITKGILTLALSLLCVPVIVAQCVQITGLNVTLGANGTASVNPSTTGSTGLLTTYYWQVNPAATQTSGSGASTGTFQFPANGSYTVCLQISDSSNFCMSNQYCALVNITNMSANSCQAGFTYNTDSSCVTHFVNTSQGNNLNYIWYIAANTYTVANPNVSLTNGVYTALLYTYSNGQLCDSTSQTVSVNCGGGNPSGGCYAGFNYYTDTATCQTHLINTSTGSNLTYEWYDITNTYSLVSTASNPVLNLSAGYHYLALYTYSNGQYCDSLTQTVNVSCGGTVTPVCQVNAGFVIFADSLNAGNYFAYNTSGGNGALTYLWNFGDGTTSTQQYPFHQYAVPGQYIICLTVTSATGSLSCSDMYCDSSSVHRVAAGFAMSQLTVIPQMATGIKDNSVLSFAGAYPNPLSDELTVEVRTKEATDLHYVLTDALGRVVSKGALTDAKTSVNTSAMEKGFYSLTVCSAKGDVLKTIKLIK